MASQQQQGHSSYVVNNFPPPVDQIRKKNNNGQQKREKLEKEVVMLEKMLTQEERMHEILEKVHIQQDGSSISIPSFLPFKMKELLAELAMVEGEIARLEGQIGQLRLNLKHEREITKEVKSKQLQSGGNFEATTGADQIEILSKQQEQGNEKNVTFDTKTLHFISKAIKGDYTLSDFSVNEKVGNPKTGFDQKESQFQVEVRFQETPLRKSGIFKPPPSPVREFTRHPSPMPKPRGRGDNPMDFPPRPIPSPNQWDENSNLHPNKLSENIMKCLNFIYVRLLRTSRAVELEKSGAVSRSMNSSLSSRSFRVEPGFNPASSLALQKESRQQDPFGVFDMEESIPRDIGPYKNLVVFTSSSVDPKCISSSSSVPLLKKLRVLMNSLQVVDLRPLNYQHKLAFWINMYNACIMHGYLQYGVPDSPENFLHLLNKAALNVGGNVVTARSIEHYVLRRPAPSKQESGEDDKETIIHKLYGLESANPNVTFALCCGTRSSPAVKIYTADGVITELEKSKLEYLQASIVVKSSKKIGFPELLLRNMPDFAADINSLVQWVCHQLPTSGSLRKSMVDCFRSHNGGKVSVTVEKMPYDFEFQYLLPM